MSGVYITESVVIYIGLLFPYYFCNVSAYEDLGIMDTRLFVIELNLCMPKRKKGSSPSACSRLNQKKGLVLLYR